MSETTTQVINNAGKNSRFVRKRAVTLPVLKLEKGVTRYLALLTPMYQGERIDDQKGAATLIKAVDLETGEFGLIIAPTIMQNELSRHYRDDGYVGKAFEITITRQTGKDYNHVTLIEVGIPEDMEAVVNQLRKEAGAGFDPVAAQKAAASMGNRPKKPAAKA